VIDDPDPLWVSFSRRWTVAPFRVSTTFDY
jgi:hypothetical protein